MAIISKSTEVQEELNVLYDSLLDRRSFLQNELKALREKFNKECDTYISSGYDAAKVPTIYNKLHHQKFVEYDMYCYIIDIVNDFRDIYGNFPEYVEMYDTLYSSMIQFADEEYYECAAIVKIWVDRLYTIIVNKD